MNLPSSTPTARTHRRRGHVAALIGLIGLVFAYAAPGFAAPPPAELDVSARGIGPLVLGVPLVEASRQALPLAPGAAMLGPGCDERDQITVVLRVAGQAMAVMAMADAQGRIEEILATPAGSAGVRLADAQACRAWGADFAHRLSATLGTVQAESVRNKPVSIEFTFEFGNGTGGEIGASRGTRIVSRWY